MKAQPKKHSPASAPARVRNRWLVAVKKLSAEVPALAPVIKFLLLKPERQRKEISKLVALLKSMQVKQSTTPRTAARAGDEHWQELLGPELFARVTAKAAHHGGPVVDYVAFAIEN